MATLTGWIEENELTEKQQRNSQREEENQQEQSEFREARGRERFKKRQVHPLE